MNICCGIVLFNPEIERLKKNIDAIENQVSEIVLVDNGSENICKVKEYFSSLNKIRFLENHSNMGIAFALNQIQEYAEERDYQWVLSLDQDSICDKNLITEYKKYINSQTGIICAKIIDLNDSDTFEEEDFEEIGDSTKIITSGSLIRTSVWDEVGKYDNRLFIDYVDTEFQERVLRSGYKIIKLNNTYVLHEIGKMKVVSILGIKIHCSNHSAFRRYYMVRNRLYFKRKYFGWNGYFKERIRLILGDVKILLFEQDKIHKIKASQRGYRDYRELL